MKLNKNLKILNLVIELRTYLHISVNQVNHVNYASYIQWWLCTDSNYLIYSVCYVACTEKYSIFIEMPKKYILLKSRVNCLRFVIIEVKNLRYLVK